MGKIAFGSAGGGNVEILTGSAYADLRIPLSLKVDTNSANDFSSTESFTLDTKYHRFRNFTINSGHLMTLGAGLTWIECSGDFTVGGDGIAGQTGSGIGILDNFTLVTTGANGSGGAARPNVTSGNGQVGVVGSVGGVGASGGGASGGSGGFGQTGGYSGGSGAGGTNAVGSNGTDYDTYVFNSGGGGGGGAGGIGGIAGH